MAPEEGVSEPLASFARIVLLLVLLTAATKPAEIFSAGEQSFDALPAVDFLFRCVVLAGSFLAMAIAVCTRRIRRASLAFVPFLAWAFVITVANQASFDSAKQLGSYATWIFFYVAANALFQEPEDYKTLVYVTVASVFLSAAGGELQHLFGYGPLLGTRWPDTPDMEFMRTHTGSGGILLDTFAPYCAALLLMSIAGASRWKHIGAWLLILWGMANILRGGILALIPGLACFLWLSTSNTRRKILPFLVGGVLLGGLLFGSTIAAKISGSDESVNTSGRLDVWPQLLEWFKEAPLAGHGPDADIELLARSAVGHDLRASHNELLSTGINYGLIGIVLLWSPLCMLLLRSILKRSSVQGEAKERQGAATALVLMIVVTSLTDNTLRTPGVMILVLAPAAFTHLGQD